MKIYIAAASLEIARAERACIDLIHNGLEVTSTWMNQIRQVGSANPRDATDWQRASWAVQCLREVAASDVLWFLVPPADTATAGGWAELATAYVLPFASIVSSGDTKRSIFCALGAEFATDAAALFYLLSL